MRQLLLSFALCFVANQWSAALAQEGSLRLPIDPSGIVELTLQTPSADRIGADILRVFVGRPDTCCAGKTPVAGTYDVTDQRLTFDPAFDLILGQTYTVQTAEGVKSLSSFTLEVNRAEAPAKVLAIYPSGPSIPENTLRFYINFSTPMMPHRSAEFIKLLDAKGKADTAAFMAFTQELWNEDRTQLTLLMDPGRIKRGVAQNVAMGPALIEGAEYSIAVENGWPNARGTQKAPRFERSFKVTAPLRRLPSIDLWHIEPPILHSSAPLIISFDRPFDHQQTQSAINIFDTDGDPINGTVTLKDHERTWQFTPELPWTTTALQIVVDTKFEDVAGNNFRDLLDHTLGTELQTQGQQSITLPLLRKP